MGAFTGGFAGRALAGLIAAAAIQVLAAAPARAHGDEPRARVLWTDAATPSFAAGPVELAFELYDTKTQAKLAPEDLEVTHTKILHVFLFDPSLREFRHEHPEYDRASGLWRLRTGLAVDGRYWIWAQGQLRGGDELTGYGGLIVEKGLPAHPMPPVLGESRVGADGVSQVALSPGRIVAGQDVMLSFAFTRTDGTPVALEPFLGEMAHVVATPSDGDSLLHVHPHDHGGVFMIHARFPEAGDYRLWVQFIDGGSLRTVPLSVTVHAP